MDGKVLLVNANTGTKRLQTIERSPQPALLRKSQRKLKIVGHLPSRSLKLIITLTEQLTHRTLWLVLRSE